MLVRILSFEIEGVIQAESVRRRVLVHTSLGLGQVLRVLGHLRELVVYRRRRGLLQVLVFLFLDGKFWLALIQILIFLELILRPQLTLTSGLLTTATRPPKVLNSRK